ncbi:UNVERIFIED_CONTAM: hypothetical protein RF648_21300 [Kocuria sp. CPCC 205274]|uniref:Uncharacterized protein n=1 Tax=Herbiconiux daphne TaxID=2970914 RepID=A0ABT2HAW7_9MICO|nr:hypothetical protein [Herbiconiux daphne]MCS5737048.1 hypothetical protein [Herbiconiux daphne]
MANVNGLLISLIDDIDRSRALFGVPAERLALNDVSTGFAKDFVDHYFPYAVNRSPLGDVQIYVDNFRQVKKYLDALEKKANKTDKFFTIINIEPKDKG